MDGVYTPATGRPGARPAGHVMHPGSDPSGPVLALDTASPLVSVAVARHDQVLAQRGVELLHSSGSLLLLVDEVLAEAELTMDQLAAVAVLRGPGSFTGLRVGLATVLGFHQALGLPVAAPPTFDVLAAVAPAATELQPRAGAGRPDRRVAMVDALRDEWFVQVWRDDGWEAVSEPRRLHVADLPQLAPATLVGFGVPELAPRLPPTLHLVEPPPLAPILAGLAAAGRWAWDESLLTRPLYLRAPAVHGT